MRVTGGVRTDVGRVRRRNEDSFLVRRGLFAVADGMGGARGGDVASALTVEALAAAVPEAGATGDDLIRAVEEANRIVFERSAQDPDLEGMGTTVTAVLSQASGATLAHVGDSRAYLMRGGELRQVTEDHTLVHRMVMEGRISPEEAAVHPARNIITRVLGVDSEVPVDRIALDLQAGDRVLVCSDGLSGMLEDVAIADLMRREPDPQQAADALVAAAVEAGGEDNVTVIVLDFDDDVEHVPAGDAAEPQTALGGAAGEGATTRPRQPREAGGPDAAARTGRHSRRDPDRLPIRRGRVVAWAAAVLVVVVVGLVGGRMYLDRQWYVGASDGQVAVYHGIPATVVGMHLSHVDTLTGLPSAQAEELAPWKDLSRGVTVSDRRQAMALVTQIRSDLTTAGLPTTLPSASPTPSASPSASSSSSLVPAGATPTPSGASP